MLVAKIIGYYLFLIFAYSSIIFEFLGFPVTISKSVAPHWLIEWGVLIAVSVTMTASLVFFVKRFVIVTARIYKNTKNYFFLKPRTDKK